MPLRTTLFVNAAFAGLLGVAAVSTYSLKHDVERTAEDLRSLKAQIAEERDNIKVLKAEWAYLNRPERLEELARRHLALEPVASEQIVPLEDVPRALTVKEE